MIGISRKVVGVDEFNLGLGAPVASIGGAGTFDGIFLTGILVFRSHQRIPKSA